MLYCRVLYIALLTELVC